MYHNRGFAYSCCGYTRVESHTVTSPRICALRTLENPLHAALSDSIIFRGPAIWTL
jgi:hypothetical protein